MKNELLTAARCALADLEGIMPEFEPSGDKKHPAWKTIKELRAAIVSEEWKLQREINLIWSVEDIHAHASEIMEPPVTLTDEQAFEILQNIERRHDANIGVNWEVLEFHIESYVANMEETES